MSTSLNSAGVSNANARIAAGDVDKDSPWSMSADDENALLGSGGDDWANYGKWFLGIHSDAPEKTKAHYGYPVGKGGKVYRGAVIAIKSRAAAQGDTSIADAAASMLEKIDGKKESASEDKTDSAGEKHIDLGKVMHRDLRDAKIEIRMDGSTQRVSFSGSSEYPVERFWGTEILSHAPGAVRMARVQAGMVPILFNHDRDKPVGMVDSLQLVNGRSMAEGHLFDTPFAKEVGSMIAGGLRGTSAGYQIHAVQEGKDDTFTATDWEPTEFSVATLPADPTVGVGRTLLECGFRVIGKTTAISAGQTRSTTMTDATAASAAAAAGNVTQAMDGATTERLRISAIDTLSKRNYGNGYKPSEDDRARWINEGKSPDEVSNEILGQIALRAQNTQTAQASAVGLTAREVEAFSISRAVRACVEKSWPKVAPFEAEVSAAIGRKMGKQGSEHSFFVPLEVQWARALGGERANTIVAGTGSQGGYLVATTVQSFIDILRNRSVVMRMGATMMPGLTSSVTIPKKTGTATAYWFASEAGTATESTLVFAQVPLSPKTVGGYLEVSRQLLLQTAYNADAIINADLAAVIGLAVDAAALNGPGTAGQPTGILSVTGVGTANPGTGTASTYADLIRFQSTVAASNAFMPGFGFVTTPTVAGIFMGKPRFTNSDTPQWEGNILDGTCVGCPAMSSLQMGSGSMLAGDFSNVVIGEWGVLEIEANPYAQFQSGIVGIRALYSVDVACRYGAAFALGTGFIS